MLAGVGGSVASIPPHYWVNIILPHCTPLCSLFFLVFFVCVCMTSLFMTVQSEQGLQPVTAVSVNLAAPVW